MDEIAVDVPTEQIQDFCRKWCVTEFALFGSVLRDDFRANSDVDILLATAPTTRRGLSETIQMRDELRAIFGRDVDLMMKPAIERSENWLRRENILNSAKIIYVS